MKNMFSERKYFILTILGYVVIGACSSGFYQNLYFSEDSLPTWFWIVFGAFGSIILVAKNILGGKDKQRFIFKDIFYVIPTVFLPLIPIGHDIALILTLIYMCVFIGLFTLKSNYWKK